MTIPSIAILNVLNFLDWEERLELSDVFLPIPLISTDQIAIPCKWFYERLLEESFVVAFPNASVVELLFYVNLRNSIYYASMSETAYTPIVSASLMLAPDEYKLPVRMSKVFDQVVPMGDSIPIMKSCIRSSSRRFGLPKERKLSMSTLNVDSELGEMCLIRGEHFAKTFSLISIRDDQLRLDAMEFVNGRNLCYILTGCVVDSNACCSLLDQLTSHISLLMQIRSNQLARHTYNCKANVNITCVTRTGQSTIYDAKGLGRVSVELASALSRRLSGHVCLEISLLHEFSKPVCGSHANRFLLCVPSSVDRSRSGSNLDTFALRKCLRAIKLNQSFVPSKESRLTQYLGLLSDHQIRIVAVVSNENEEKTKASVAGLRFAELD